MTRIRSLACCFFFIAAATASAQGPAAGGSVGIGTGVQGSYNRVKMLITQSAEKMADADYGFKPTPDIRTFGQLWGHVANAQYGACAQVLGVPNPNMGTNLETAATTKAAVVKALAESFAFCDTAFAALTDQNAAEALTGGRGGPTARAVVLTGLLTHSNEMYGIGSVYLRLKGLVPPSTEMQRGRE